MLVVLDEHFVVSLSRSLVLSLALPPSCTPTHTDLCQKYQRHHSPMAEYHPECHCDHVRGIAKLSGSDDFQQAIQTRGACLNSGVFVCMCIADVGVCVHSRCCVCM